jgi:hypothetical protein
MMRGSILLHAGKMVPSLWAVVAGAASIRLSLSDNTKLFKELSVGFGQLLNSKQILVLGTLSLYSKVGMRTYSL